jgi:hypothetical protein
MGELRLRADHPKRRADLSCDRRVPRRFNDVSLFIDATGESGDHDALPHIPATDPATVPPDHGDAGPDGSAG